MADATIFGLTQETAMTAAARLALQKTSGATRATSATFALLGGLEVKTSSPTTGNVSPNAGEFHWLDVSGMTANRAFILPVAASIQTGERIGVGLSVGDAGFEFELKSGAAGDLINGVDHSSTPWSQIFITGEVVIFRCIDGATGDWVVEHDGRIPCSARMDDEGGTAFTTTATTPDFDTTQYDIGGLIDLANDKFVLRRAGKYKVVFGHTSEATVDDTNHVQANVSLDPGGTPVAIAICKLHSSAANLRVSVPVVFTRAFLDADEIGIEIGLGGAGSNYTSGTAENVRPAFSINEVL